jgi:nitrous oxidase accessory protein
MGGYRNISKGVSAAKDGQTVYIAPGLYRENVLVDKSVRLVGLFDRYIGINGMGGNYAVRMTANGAGIEDIVVLNATNGIEVVSCNDVNITMCKAFYCNIGLSLANCTGTLVDGCTFMRNGGAGMYLADTMDVHVKNTASSENGYGFGMYYAPYTTFENCTANFNSKAGFYLYWLSFGTRILNASCTLNDMGVHVLDVDDVTIMGCTLEVNVHCGIHMMSRDSRIEDCQITTDEGDGILLENSEQVLVRGNYVGSSDRGIVLSSTAGSLLRNNTLNQNEVGIKLARGSTGNTIEDNDLLLSSSLQTTALTCGDNLWSGNYWQDSSGMDLDSDGVHDAPYLIDGHPTDTDDRPRAFPRSEWFLAPEVHWTGDLVANGTIDLSSSTRPVVSTVNYLWTVLGCGLDQRHNTSDISVSPLRPGNLSVTLEAFDGTHYDQYTLVLTILEPTPDDREGGLGILRAFFLILTLFISFGILVVLTMMRRFRRPLPPAPRW